ncbi:YaiI/YqxD family protein [Alkalicoccobacillus murimartini]|uniref:UPF0178 protein J2S05_000326 n=1 Tax=Alkalicoccobacillus murimartini TaxID=171685 RepID=A0ABT9YCH6_9BACI|nr:DUF188 domain-containing protein [Alkalicoccobacillus murimartini]MDQ0205552.1 uncharacterized protein YaiI (UPF0178 family) [Alkalicoccobacillus murimartini]
MIRRKSSFSAFLAGFFKGVWNQLNTMDETKPTISLFIDADSCPVKEEILTYRFLSDLRIVFVMSYAHMMNLPQEVDQVMVDSDKEAVDLYIMNKIKAGDVCVTQDHALASLLLRKKVRVLSPRGIQYLEESIEQLLDVRYMSAQKRRRGIRTKGPKPFTEEDRNRFVQELKIILQK